MTLWAPRGRQGDMGLLHVSGSRVVMCLRGVLVFRPGETPARVARAGQEPSPPPSKLPQAAFDRWPRGTPR